MALLKVSVPQLDLIFASAGEMFLLWNWLKESLPWRSFERNRKEFIAVHESIYVKDEEFVSSIFHKPTQAETVVSTTLRRLVAEQCHLPAEKLQHQDKTWEI